MWGTYWYSRPCALSINQSSNHPITMPRKLRENAHTVLDFGTSSGEFSGSSPDRFTTGGNSRRSHWTQNRCWHYGEERLSWRMPPSGILRRVVLIRTDASEQHIAFIIGVTRIGVLRLLVTANVVPNSPILVILIMEAIRSFGTSALTRPTRCHILEDDILHSHCCENLEIYAENHVVRAGNRTPAVEST
jgi:hypothetical protein